VGHPGGDAAHTIPRTCGDPSVFAYGMKLTKKFFAVSVALE